VGEQLARHGLHEPLIVIDEKNAFHPVDPFALAGRAA
jgi:hypothetical protein